MAQNGVKYHNLFEYLNSKAKEGQLGNDQADIKEAEFREALV